MGGGKGTTDEAAPNTLYLLALQGATQRGWLPSVIAFGATAKLANTVGSKDIWVTHLSRWVQLHWGSDHCKFDFCLLMLGLGKGQSKECQ